MRELLDMGLSLARQAAAPDSIGYDDKTLLAELMIRALRDDPLSSKETRLRLQGQLAFRRMLEESGGAYTAAEAAALLNITEDTVRKRTRKGKLLVVPQGQHSIYPVFQFNGGTLVRGLDATARNRQRAGKGPFFPERRQRFAGYAARCVALGRSGAARHGATQSRTVRPPRCAVIAPPPAGGHDKLRIVTVPAGSARLRIAHRRYPTALYFGKGAEAGWIYEAPEAVDGIRYPSRLWPDGENTALFERCCGALTEHRLGSVLQWQHPESGKDIFDALDEQGWGLL